MIGAAKTPSRITSPFRQPLTAAMSLAVMVSLSLVRSALADDVTWDGGGAGTGTAWRTGSNWNTDVVPGPSDNAVFDSVGTVTTCAIDMGGAGGTQQVGMVTMGAGRANALSIRNLTSSTTDGILQLNGVSGLVLSNSSTTAALTFTNASTGKLLGLGLATNGIVYSIDGGGTAGQISIFSVISEIGGSRSLTKIGSGILYLRGVNKYTGSTTVLEGNLEVDDTGTIGNGAGTLFLSGGNLLAGATRNGTASDQLAVSNAIVVTADAYIQNKTGTATTRYLALAGPLSGSAGTLKIANPTTAPGNIFAVRFFNSSFTFNRPMIVGDPGYDLSLAFSVMESANTNGTQTFSGDITGVGSIRRLNPFSAGTAAGNTVFTGNNTYSGGTFIASGTLFANNAISSLGSGGVLVTNVGILAGNGTIGASTTVMANGTISPGASANTVGNLTVNDLTLGTNANYIWHITAATGSAGVNWDLITATTSWTDAATSGSAISLKIDSLGSTPTGWNPAVARDWVIIQSGAANGFDPSHFTLDTSAFVGTVQGVFALSESGGSLHLTYTPAGDTVINVPVGSVTQGQTSPTPYPILTGSGGIVKIGNGEVVITNSLNDYQGGTKVNAGTVTLAVDALNGSGGLGVSTTPVLLGNTLGNSNAAININAAGVTLGRGVQVQAGSSGTKTLGASITSGTALFTGDVTLQDSAILSAVGGGEASFSGNFTGAGGLTIGGGIITLSAANSYAGPTTLTGGTLILNGKAIGTNTFTISGASILDNTSGATVTLNNSPQNWNANFTFAGSTNLNLGSGPVTMNATRTVTVNASTLSIGGTIAGSAGLVKLGPGTLAIGSPTTNSYTGGTTVSAGAMSINGTGTFGDGTGTLLLNGGNILNTGTRSGAPIANPVTMSADTTIYGNSTATAPSTRILPFSGNWTVTGGTLRVGNTGLASNIFDLRLTAGMNITWPVIIGDTNFDTAGAVTELQLYNDNTTPVQTVSGLVTGTGSIRRGNLASGAGGTTIMAGNNTYAGGFVLDSGTLGIGLSSTPTTGAVTSGPLGTGTFEIDNDPAIFIFASGGARTIANNVYLNGVTNMVFTGTNALTFTGPVDSGGVAKTLTVSNTATVTFSGSITNTAALTKAGPGKLVFSGDNSLRTNSTTVNAGTLLVNNVTGNGTGSGAVTVNTGGALGGSGTLGASVTVNAGGTLAPGASIGTLTINGDLTLAGDVAIEVNKSSSPSNDLVVVSGALANTGTGTLNVNNLGAALTVGNRFQVFSGPVVNGDALTVTGGSVTWTNQLAVDGSITVISTGGSTPPNFSGNSMTILPNGTVSLTATGGIGSSYKLWASTNVAATPISTTWTLLQSGTVTTSPFTVQDPTATNFTRRFYIFSAP